MLKGHTQIQSRQLWQLHDGIHTSPCELTVSCIQACQLPEQAHSLQPWASS